MIPKMIRVIAFDFGGTLFSTARMGSFTPKMADVFCSRVIHELGCSGDVAASVFTAYTDAWKARRVRGEDLPEQETSSLDLLASATAKTATNLTKDQMITILNAFHSVEAEQFTPLRGVLELLPTLVREGYQLCIVSNNPWTESIRASLRRYGMESIFEHIIVSCDVGFRKPYRQIFHELMVKSGIEASEILFVGDSFTHDIEMPKVLGMKTCLVDFEGMNKNNQSEKASEPDLFLTSFDQLGSALKVFD